MADLLVRHQNLNLVSKQKWSERCYLNSNEGESEMNFRSLTFDLLGQITYRHR